MAYHPRRSVVPMQSEINMIPLIDVMLVLLIIFIVAAPMMTHGVKVDLPKVSDAPSVTKKPDFIELGIKANGSYFWNGEAKDPVALEASMREAGSREQVPAIYLQADANVPYTFVAQTLTMASRAGLGKIGLLSQPVKTE